MACGLNETERAKINDDRDKEFFDRCTYQTYLGTDGLGPRYSFVWRKMKGQKTTKYSALTSDAVYYFGNYYPGKLQLDLSAYAPFRVTTEQRYTEKLRVAEDKLATNPTDVASRFSKATALYYLGRYSDALPLLTKLVEEKPTELDYFRYRAFTFAKMGQREDALRDSAAHEKLTEAPYRREWAATCVHAYLGEPPDSLKRLDDVTVAHPDHSTAWFFAACGYGKLTERWPTWIRKRRGIWCCT